MSPGEEGYTAVEYCKSSGVESEIRRVCCALKEIRMAQVQDDSRGLRGVAGAFKTVQLPV